MAFHGATRESWWVPYELGTADTKGKIVSYFIDRSANRKKVMDDLPSFLETKVVMAGLCDVFKWCEHFTITGITEVAMRAGNLSFSRRDRFYHLLKEDRPYLFNKKEFMDKKGIV